MTTRRINVCGYEFDVTPEEYERITAQTASLVNRKTPMSKLPQRLRTKENQKGASEARPLRSKSLAIHPSQVADYNERVKRSGNKGAHYTPDGTLEFCSEKGKRMELKRRECVDHGDMSANEL